MKIRKQLIAFILVAVMSNAAVAGDVSFGIKAGLNYTAITNNPKSWDDNLEWKAGISAGAFLSYRFNEWLSLQPELLYSQRGVNSKLLDYSIIEVDLTAAFSYIEIPLLLEYTVPLEGSFRPVIYAGPVLSYMLSSELELSASILSATVDIGSLSHVNDFGGILGAGFEWDVGNGLVTFDVRYQRGFTNVITSGDFEINGDPQVIEADDVKNQGLAFLVGYAF